MPDDRSSGLTDNCPHARSISSVVQPPIARWCHWPASPLRAKNETIVVITLKFYGMPSLQLPSGNLVGIVQIAGGLPAALHVSLLIGPNNEHEMKWLRVAEFEGRDVLPSRRRGQPILVRFCSRRAGRLRN